MVGGGTPALQPDERVDLALLDERRFANGTVYLRYRVHAAVGLHRFALAAVAPHGRDSDAVDVGLEEGREDVVESLLAHHRHDELHAWLLAAAATAGDLGSSRATGTSRAPYPSV